MNRYVDYPETKKDNPSSESDESSQSTEDN